MYKNQPSGRASLIIPGIESGNAEGARDNTLLEFVRAGHPVDRVVADILVHWKVVPDLKAAFNVCNTDNKPLFYITRDGEILTPWGELVFGDKDKASSGILARKAEISGLTARENELRESSMQIRIEEDEISKGLLKAEAGLREVNEKKGSISGDRRG